MLTVMFEKNFSVLKMGINLMIYFLQRPFRIQAWTGQCGGGGARRAELKEGLAEGKGGKGYLRQGDPTGKGYLRQGDPTEKEDRKGGD